MLRIDAIEKNVGDRLKARRTAIGMSIETLADELGLMKEQIEIWEAGQGRIPRALLLDIAKTLGINPIYFFRRPHSVEVHDEVERKGYPSEISVEAYTPTEQDRLLIAAFRKIRDHNKRDSVLKFAQSLAGADNSGGR